MSSQWIGVSWWDTNTNRKFITPANAPYHCQLVVWWSGTPQRFGYATAQTPDPEPATFSVDDVTLAEGDGGTTDFVFTVSRSGDTNKEASVHWETADGTAFSSGTGADYTAVAKTQLAFAAEVEEQTVTVRVNGDLTAEYSETFTVVLSDPSRGDEVDAGAGRWHRHHRQRRRPHQDGRGGLQRHLRHRWPDRPHRRLRSPRRPPEPRADEDANSALRFDHPLSTWGVGSSVAIGDWEWVTVSGGRVVELDLYALAVDDQIHGAIPAELGNATALFDLRLQNDWLTGPVPAALSSLTEMETLRLQQNLLSGVFPTAVAALFASDASALDVYSNCLSGPSPSPIDTKFEFFQGLATTNTACQFTIRAEPASVAEGDGTVTITIIADYRAPAGLPFATEITVTIAAGTATGGGTDYTAPAPVTVTVPAVNQNPSPLTDIYGNPATTPYTGAVLGPVPAGQRSAGLGHLRDHDQRRLRAGNGDPPETITLTGAAIGFLVYPTSSTPPPAMPGEATTISIYVSDDAAEFSEDAPTMVEVDTVPPTVGEPESVALAGRFDYLSRMGVTPAQHAANQCVGESSLAPAWQWERADPDSFNPANPDYDTWTTVPSRANASYVYVPQASDEGKFLRASLTVGTVTITTDVIGPIGDSDGVAAANVVTTGVTIGDDGMPQVGETLTASQPDAARTERADTAINPDPTPWQWERADNAAFTSNVTNVTPYACGEPSYEYQPTSGGQGKYLRAHVYYQDDSSGTVVLKRAETNIVGPIAAE